MNRKKDMTSERMFLGALEKAYSRPVMEAKISEMAMSTYEPVWAQTLMGAGSQLSPAGRLPQGD